MTSTTTRKRTRRRPKLKGRKAHVLNDRVAHVYLDRGGWHVVKVLRVDTRKGTPHAQVAEVGGYGRPTWGGPRHWVPVRSIQSVEWRGKRMALADYLAARKPAKVKGGA